MTNIKTIILGLCAVAVIAAAAEECAFEVERNGRTQRFELGALTHPVGAREHLYAHTADGGRVYVNLCAPTTVACAPHTSVCLLTPDYHYVARGATGALSAAPLACAGCAPQDGITATFNTNETCTNASVCFGHLSIHSPFFNTVSTTPFFAFSSSPIPPQERHTTAVHIICDKSETPFIEKVTGGAKDCRLEIFVRAHAVCSAALRQGPVAALVALTLLAATLLVALF